MDETKQPEFTVRDRRKASAEAEGAAEGKKDTAPTEMSEDKGPGPSEAPRADKTGRPAGEGPPPEIDFSSFILSLTATAQISLGLAPDPQSNLTSQNIPAAKQMIDLIGLLRDKTKGNLSKDEQELIDTVLTNLRMLYVRTAEGKR